MGEESGVERDIWGPERGREFPAGSRKGDLRGVGVGMRKKRTCLETGN